LLKKCSNPDCEPVEQIRGEMGPGDYRDVEVNQGPTVLPPGPRHASVDHYKYVELGDWNRNDFRICCMSCGNATGWVAKDLPNMPDAGADYARKKWNESIA